MKNKSKLRGFTLIEELFVIAIFAVLVLMGFGMVGQHNQEVKIEKAALQIQQILQAATAYYINNGCWPVQSGLPTGCLVSSPRNFVSDYSMYIQLNPWGNSYSWASVGDNLFAVNTDCPTEDIARRLADRLPNVVVSANGSLWNVQIETNIPMQSNYLPVTLPKYTLVAVGKDTMIPNAGYNAIEDGHTKTLASFVCPANSLDAKAMISIIGIAYYRNQLNTNSDGYLPTIVKNMHFSVNKVSCSDPTVSCQMNITLDYGHGVTCLVTPSAPYIPGYPSESKYLTCFGSGPLGENPNIASITYQYQIYCCSTNPCFSPTTRTI